MKGTTAGCLVDQRSFWNQTEVNHMRHRSGTTAGICGIETRSPGSQSEPKPRENASRCCCFYLSLRVTAAFRASAADAFGPPPWRASAALAPLRPTARPAGQRSHSLSPTEALRSCHGSGDWVCPERVSVLGLKGGKVGRG